MTNRVQRELDADLFSRLIATTDGPPKLKAAGLAVKAADTGRVLMIQRSMADPKDPARGKLEFPGGCLEPGEDARDAAVREWEEETGQKLPAGRHAGSWTSPNKIYRGHVFITPSEAHVPVGALRKGTIANPDDPDHSEALMWHDPKLLKDNPAVRREVRSSTDWDVLGAKPQPSDRLTDQQWNTNLGPSQDRSPLHQGPEGNATPKAPGHAPGEQFPESYVTVNPADGGKGKQLKVLVADSPARRALGLQNSPDLSGHDGMLLKWPADTIGSLHNRNVSVPVGATWFNSSGLFVDHQHMLPDDGTAKTPKGPHRYVLETNAKDCTDCDSLGIGPGCSLDMGTDPNSATTLT